MQVSRAARLEQLETLKSQHVGQMELEFEQSNQPQTFKQAHRKERQRDIDRVFDDYRDWLRNTRTTEDEPYIQVVAVFTGQPATEDH